MNRVFFSPGNDCLDAIIGAIAAADFEVKICVFTISDNRIVDALKQALNRGVRIRIITDNDKRFDRGSDIHYLAQFDIQIKIDKTLAHMHHKFAVIDKRVCITGSYNWTRSAQERNYENVLVSDNRKMTKAYSDEFDKLWSAFDFIDKDTGTKS